MRLVTSSLTIACLLALAMPVTAQEAPPETFHLMTPPSMSLDAPPAGDPVETVIGGVDEGGRARWSYTTTADAHITEIRGVVHLRADPAVPSAGGVGGPVVGTLCTITFYLQIGDGDETFVCTQELKGVLMGDMTVDLTFPLDDQVPAGTTIQFSVSGGWSLPSGNLENLKALSGSSDYDSRLEIKGTQESATPTEAEGPSGNETTEESPAAENGTEAPQGNETSEPPATTESSPGDDPEEPAAGNATEPTNDASAAPGEESPGAGIALVPALAAVAAAIRRRQR